MSDEQRPWSGEFENLLRAEDIDDPTGFMKPVESFDEVPLYSRYAQLSFLAHLPTEQQNRQLIAAGAHYLRRVVGHLESMERDKSLDAFCMLSVTGWEDWEAAHGAELLVPSVWFTNPSNGTLRLLQLRPGESEEAEFVRSALPDDGSSFEVYESAGATPPRVRRVYVACDPVPPPSRP